MDWCGFHTKFETNFWDISHVMNYSLPNNNDELIKNRRGMTRPSY